MHPPIHIVDGPKFKKLIEKVMSYIVTISDKSDVTLSEILEECGVTAKQYDIALGCVEKKVSILYKQRPCEVNIGLYNAVILKFLKSNVKLNYVTSVYTILTCLTSYLCKTEYAMSEHPKRPLKRLMAMILKVKCVILIIYF